MLGRSAVLARRGANGAVGLPGPAGGVADNPLAPGMAEATWLKAGADEVQPWGTDSAPSEAARPTPAVTAPPMPGVLRAPAPDPTPLLSTEPKT